MLVNRESAPKRAIPAEGVFFCLEVRGEMKVNAVDGSCSEKGRFLCGRAVRNGLRRGGWAVFSVPFDYVVTNTGLYSTPRQSLLIFGITSALNCDLRGSFFNFAEIISCKFNFNSPDILFQAM